MRKSYWGLGFGFCGMVMLILDARTAIAGAREGIELCLHSIIPSLFPFLILATFLTPYLSAMSIPVLRPFSRFLGLPEGAEGIFLAGLLGGYPTGARMISTAWNNGQLDRKNAMRMLGFCSNAGPAFIFGILGRMFSSSLALWSLWGVHILSAILVGVMLPGTSGQNRKPATAPNITFTDAVKSSVSTMGTICAWVVLFRILLIFLDRWCLWLFPVEIRTAIYGILELANGCCALDGIQSEGLRYILCSFFLAFGGICVTMQTASVAGDLGLGSYLPGKILQGIISVFLAITLEYFIYPNVIQPILMVIAGVIITLFALMAVKMKNRGRNPVKFGV